MMKHIVLPALLSLAALSPALANVDLVPWGESGAWKILKDPNYGDGCLVETGYGDGTYVRIGFDRKGDGTGYVSSFNPAWVDIKDGKKYDVTVSFADQSFVGEGRGGKLGDMPGIIVKANNLDLLVALAKSESVKLSADGGAGIELGLKGSEEALKQALVCQAE